MKLKRIGTVLIYCAVAAFAFSAGAPDNSTETVDPLPVTDVVLFNTGVGYFQRSGTIDDTATVDIIFESASINDLLKSLVISDLDGGTVSWVTYASREPVLQSMQALSVNLASNPPFLQILAQLRGERVTLDFENGTSATGSIVGIENTGSEVRINILDDRERIRNYNATEITAFRSSDPKIREELERALVLLAESKYKDAKRVSVRFTGEGSRRVHLGYVLPAPVWKASYRLVVGEDELLLQAWAIIENLTREGWDEVSVSLVSGLPISFEMDLYRPIFIRRPSVDVDVAKSVAPPTYEEPSPVASSAIPQPRESMNEMSRTSSGFGVSDMGAGEGGSSFLDMESSVKSAAVGVPSGEFFQYRISEPITLARSESGMVPIAAEFIDGQKLSIFNPSTHPSHPLHSVRIENTTNLDFVGGPVTVFESDSYAGDSRLQVLRAGESQLISYAVDLSATIGIFPATDPEHLTHASITEGVLETEERTERRAAYRIDWNHEDDRKLLIERAIAHGWNLIEPTDVVESTPSYYRFTVDPLATPLFTVSEERIRKNIIRLNSTNDSTIRRYAEHEEVSVAVSDALFGILTRKTEITNIGRLIRANENRRSDIFRDQQRIRENIEKIAEGSEIYERYLAQLASQEDELEILVNNIRVQTERETRQREELAEYIRNLQAE